eukprot:357415-Chlamydomonas_euryale.AAC.6
MNATAVMRRGAAPPPAPTLLASAARRQPPWRGCRATAEGAVAALSICIFTRAPIFALERRKARENSNGGCASSSTSAARGGKGTESLEGCGRLRLSGQFWPLASRSAANEGLRQVSAERPGRQIGAQPHRVARCGRGAAP